MPAKASEMGAYLARTSGARLRDPAGVARISGQILSRDDLLPAQRAALYEYLATLPGITVVRDATDIAGRPGVGVPWTSGGARTMIIFSATTFSYLGTDNWGAGGQVSGEALITMAIVSHVGQYP
jgi:hypothetical protein